MNAVDDATSVSETARLLYSRRSAAKVLDISVRMVDYALASGQLEARRLNSRVLIPFESLVKFAAADRVVPKDPARDEHARDHQTAV